MPPRPLSNADQLTWAAYAQQVRPLPGRKAPPAPPTTPSPTPKRNEPTPPPHIRVRNPTPSLVTGLAPAGLDRASWNRFSGGKLPPARTLDLHGKTAQAAFHALQTFLLAAHAENLRCVEIITGRGSGEQGGIIRRELPLWLNLPTLRPLVLAATHPHPRNPGSTRLLLRRGRQKGHIF